MQLASKNLIHAIDKNSNYHDSLSFYLFFSGYSAHFSPNTSGYELLESKGLDLISNDSLRQKISETYSIWYPWMLKREGENRTYLFDNLHKLRNKYLGTKSLFKDSQPKSLEENFMVNVIVSSGNIRKMINYEEFKRDSEIHGLVKGAEVRFRLEHDVHLLVETGINDLIDLIQREIQNDVSQ